MSLSYFDLYNNFSIFISDPRLYMYIFHGDTPYKYNTIDTLIDPECVAMVVPASTNE